MSPELPPLLPARVWLTGSQDAVALSLAELPHRGRCDPEIADRILERLAPYVGDFALAFCDFDDCAAYQKH